jgi:hypothetical protein
MLIQKYEFEKGQNQDVTPKLLQEGQYLQLQNARVAVSEQGRTLQVENCMGTTLKSQAVLPPYGTSYPIGSVLDEARNRIITFFYNTFDDHCITCYDFAADTIYAVIYDSQVIGGLNFTRDYNNAGRIDRNAKVIGDLLYWTDNYNEPRRLNIEAGIKMNHASYTTNVEPYSYPMNPEVITIIRRPVPYDPDIAKGYDSSFANNFIANSATQYSIRLNYRDYEQSVIGAWSELAPYNYSTETNNFIRITYPTTYQFDQDVDTAELIVKFGNTATVGFVIKTFTRADLDAHNAGTQLSFSYYNDLAGIAVGEAAMIKSFESVPLLSETIEQAKNKLYLGNNTEGYDTPTTTSLAATVASVTSGASDQSGVWKIMTVNLDNGGVITTIERYILVVVGLSPSLYIFSTGTVPAPPAAPPTTTISVASATYSTSSIPQMANFIAGAFSYDSYDYLVDDTAYTVTVSGGTAVLANGARAFKADGGYRYANVFFDKYRRKCGVVFPSNNKITTADRSYSQTVYNVGINWTLSNTSALTEIPDWAYFYSPVRTRCLSTRNFLQARTAASGIKYVTKDNDGVYDYTVTAYSANNYGIALDISTLISFGLGYVFSDGDLVKLYLSGVGTVYELPILAQDGKWLIVGLKDLGTFSTQTPLFQIYTPYKEQVDENYFEVGQVYNVTDAGTNSRQYSVTSGTFNGDVYLLQRTDSASSTYFTEAMSPNDKFWQNWYEDIGWNNIIDSIGQQAKTQSISFSNIYIEGTKTNGLSSWDALDETALPIECGTIQKLQVTSKVNNELGIVMLAICKYETASLYLGETQQYGSSASSTVSVSTQTIGTVNVLKGSFGTQNPETVIEYNGLVWFLDMSKGAVVQYSTNGLGVVSDFGMRRFFQRYCKRFMEIGNSDIYDLNGFSHIAFGIDPFYKELLIVLPSINISSTVNNFPSYSNVAPSYATSILNRFDIYDLNAKTMSFSFEENLWKQTYQYIPQWLDALRYQLVGWYSSNFYLHNQNSTNWNTWYGQTYPIRIWMAANIPPSVMKNLANIVVQGNCTPDYSVAYVDYPDVQITDLTVDDYNDLEGEKYAHWLRDRSSPNTSGTAINKMNFGDVLKSELFYILTEYQQYTALAYINWISIGWMPSRGHGNIIPK